MSEINQNYSQYNMSQAYSDGQQIRPISRSAKIPNYYQVDTKEKVGFVESIKRADMMGIVTPFFEHPFWVLGAWLGISAGLDGYSNACSGKYENSLVANAARLGDNLQNSRLIQNEPVQSFLSMLKSVKDGGRKIEQKSAVLTAMKDTPTRPEWQFVRATMYNQEQEIVQDFLRITEALKLDSDNLAKLEDIGMSKAEKEMLKKAFNTSKISQIPESQAVNCVLLSRLGKTQEEIKIINNKGEEKAAQIVKKEILDAMGLTKEKLNNIKNDDFGKYINDVREAAGRVGNKVRMGGGHYHWLGPLTKPFERTVGCDGVYNKLHSLSEGAKTGTGRFFSRSIQLAHRGLTFNNGKLGALFFIAPMAVSLGHNVVKADSDQKTGTLFGGLINMMSWVITFPLTLKIMHAFGGIKYAGMSKDQVEEYRKVLNEFNAKVKNMEFKDKKAYNLARKDAKQKMSELSKVKGQNIFIKGLRKLSHLFTMDLETINSFRNGNFAGNTVRKLPNFLKNCGGVPLRLVAFGLIGMGVLESFISKITTKIFGKSYDEMKTSEEEENIRNQKAFLKEDLNERLYNIADRKQKEEIIQQLEATRQNSRNHNNVSSRGKGINSAEIPVSQMSEAEEKIDNYTYIPSQENIIPHPVKQGVDNYTYIPSSECVIKSDKGQEKNIRKYIPSQAAANITKTWDNSKLQAALDRADQAEAKALRVLSGNFEGM